MNILINASNLYVGGGVQVAISFIEELALQKKDYLIVVSPVIYEQLSPTTQTNCIVLGVSPSKILNFAGRKKLDDYIFLYSITHVFTIFGPSYWRPKKKVKHLVGFALPWLIYDTKDVYKKLTFMKRFKMKLLIRLQRFYYKFNADVIVTETFDASRRLEAVLGVESNSVHTVSNTLSGVFKLNSNQVKHCDADNLLGRLPKGEDDVLLLTISHNYPHKNLDIIYKLLPLLPDRYKFVLTVTDSFKNRIPSEYSKRVITLGSVTQQQCSLLYRTCHATFLPTLLECFSANYPESFYFRKPVITSERGFSRIVCGEAASYFDPLNENSAVEAILKVFASPEYYKFLIEEGSKRLSLIPNAEQRAKRYISIIEGL